MVMFQKVKSGFYSIKSLLIHGRFKSTKWDYKHHVVPPISSSSAYRLDSVQRGAKGFEEFGTVVKDELHHPPIYIYDRLGEPTRGMLEDNLAFAERGDCAVTFASGMAAISAAVGVCAFSGDEIISHRVLYGSTYSLFKNWYPKMGLKVKLLDLTDPENLSKNLTKDTMVVYFETPSNPNMELIDISKICTIVKKHNKKVSEDRKIRVIIDNTFATPFCQRPIELGADIVVHSLTKNICGFGTEMGGVVITRREHEKDLLNYRKDFGAVLSPKSAWSILVYGLSTLSIRLKKQESSAMEIAKFLESHSKIEKVCYPGLPSFSQFDLANRQMTDFDGNFAPGNMIYFILKGEPLKARASSRKIIDYIAKNSYTITLAVSLGQVKTLIENPSLMTHSTVPLEEQLKDGIDPGGIRLSVGLEEPEDLIKDLKHALERV